VAGFNRKDANKIVNRLLDKYENNIVNAPLGKKYEQCWNIKAKSPLPEYVELYEDVKEEIKSYGLKLKY